MRWHCVRICSTRTAAERQGDPWLWARRIPDWRSSNSCAGQSDMRSAVVVVVRPNDQRLTRPATSARPGWDPHTDYVGWTWFISRRTTAIWRHGSRAGDDRISTGKAANGEKDEGAILLSSGWFARILRSILSSGDDVKPKLREKTEKTQRIKYMKAKSVTSFVFFCILMSTSLSMSIGYLYSKESWSISTVGLSVFNNSLILIPF